MYKFVVEKSRVQEDTAASIDTGRFKVSRNGYHDIRDGICAKIKDNKITQN